MESELEAFFKKAGAVSLFCVIEPLGIRYEEFHERIPYSRGAVNNRIDRAIELGLLEKVTHPTENETGSVTHYMPTERGMEVYNEIDARGIPPVFEEYREAKRAFESERNVFTEYIGRRENEGFWKRFSPKVERDSEPSG